LVGWRLLRSVSCRAGGCFNLAKILKWGVAPHHSQRSPALKSRRDRRWAPVGASIRRYRQCANSPGRSHRVSNTVTTVRPRLLKRRSPKPDSHALVLAWESFTELHAKIQAGPPERKHVRAAAFLQSLARSRKKGKQPMTLGGRLVPPACASQGMQA